MQDATKAKEWANVIGYQPWSHEPEEVEVAKFIVNLPDHIIDAGKLREALEGCDKMTYPYEVIEHIEKTLLTPPLLNLADMGEDARHALVGKDVKVEGWDSPSMLVAVHKDEGAVLGHTWINPWPFVEVRPLSELSPADEGRPET